MVIHVYHVSSCIPGSTMWPSSIPIVPHLQLCHLNLLSCQHIESILWDVTLWFLSYGPPSHFKVCHAWSCALLRAATILWFSSCLACRLSCGLLRWSTFLGFTWDLYNNINWINYVSSHLFFIKWLSILCFLPFLVCIFFFVIDILHQGNSSYQRNIVCLATKLNYAETKSTSLVYKNIW